MKLHIRSQLTHRNIRFGYAYQTFRHHKTFPNWERLSQGDEFKEQEIEQFQN